MSSLKGTYLFVFRLRETLNVKTAGGKRFYLPEGVYVYVGSAFGKGGISKRVLRHLKKNKPKRWHLDYITTTERWEFLFCLPIYGRRVECSVASLLGGSKDFEPVRGFGCSDCNCDAHLFRCSLKMEKSVKKKVKTKNFEKSL